MIDPKQQTPGLEPLPMIAPTLPPDPAVEDAPC